MSAIEDFPRDAFFKGCTRPAMIFGVPLVPFVLVGGGSTLLAIWGLLISPWFILIASGAAIVLTGLMRQITYQDDQRLLQWQLRLMLRFSSHRSRHFWGAVSYGAIRFSRR
ncbi:type IV secretion system protein VirB3 [Burkholderia territorii]|uniref:type IV secretion system protein VirB3 n=1 Tax=Burkholderia territorii TaxID=1503055 RepID=UPI00075371E1|nr:VirB3 family type IV secretion system protein [Burkholderia territorii]KWE37922.1 hypothetical protein WT50_21495 [Burkholderia territorii]KWE38262.1 hypothetical protein WT51_30765 [Burkholderia territorii]KWE42906.1 hypothetical protein WT49_03130 [Burkholderia territorii]